MRNPAHSTGSSAEQVPPALVLVVRRFGRGFLKERKPGNFRLPILNAERAFDQIGFGRKFRIVIPPNILKPAGKSPCVNGINRAIMPFGGRKRSLIQPQFRPNDKPEDAIRSEQHAHNFEKVKRHIRSLLMKIENNRLLHCPF